MTKFRTAIRIATLLVFVVIISLPAVLMLFGGASDGALDYEEKLTLKAPTLSSWFDGGFRDNFEGWLNRSYPFRRDVMLAYNQLKYDVESIVIGFPAADGGDTTETTAAPDTQADTDTLAVETEPPPPPYDTSNPLYAELNRLRYERELVELPGFKGTPTVIIGKSGYLYENGYINEYLGYSKMYREVTAERVAEQVEMLEYIDRRLAEQGVAFLFVLTPSKASQYPEAIPEWYMAQNVSSDSYVRPYTYLKEALAGSSLHYIDSADIYKEVGLEETFPKTGTHWNKLAAFETMNRIITAYSEQTGESIRNLTFDEIKSSDSPPGFGNPERDIFGAVYDAIGRVDNVVDDLYYWPEVYVENPDEENKINVLLQGGSFAHDFKYYFENYRVTGNITRIYYNEFPYQGDDEAKADRIWARYLKNIDYVVCECNEQFVRSLGGNAPYWANDKRGYEIGFDIYESLYGYLKRQEAGE